jgi:hypothetical protein
MILFLKSLAAWNTPAFDGILRQEIDQMDAGQLPLQHGLVTGSHVVDKQHRAMILGVTETSNIIQARAGIFYTSVIAGCNCADDPTPVDENAEYCEVRFDIDQRTAEATVTLLSD